MDKYCSPAIILVNKQVSIVQATVPNVPFANFNKELAIASNIPVFSKIPPRDKAQSIKEMVLIILINPPFDKSSSTEAIPVVDIYPFCAAFMISPKEDPWNINANKAPINAPPAKPGIAGILKITKDITNNGANKSIGDNVLYVDSNVDLIKLICVMSRFCDEYLNPITP